MNTGIKKKWVSALRSGEYKKTTRQLRHEDCFCALGVLCETIDAKKWKDLGGGKRWEWDGHRGSVPIVLRQEMGITEKDQEAVFTMNDEYDCSFGEIADWIEENL